MWPRTDIEILQPLLIEETSRMERLHNRSVKEELKEQMVRHHRVNIPSHFRQSNRSKYTHSPRRPNYLKVKSRKFKSRTDLVKSGKSRDKMTRNYDRLRAGGIASKGKVTVTMTLRWPFPVGRGSSTNPRVRVTPRKMAEELEAFTFGEYYDILYRFTQGYFKRLNAGMKPRVRKRIVGKYPGLF